MVLPPSALLFDGLQVVQEKDPGLDYVPHGRGRPLGGILLRVHSEGPRDDVDRQALDDESQMLHVRGALAKLPDKGRGAQPLPDVLGLGKEHFEPVVLPETHAGASQGAESCQARMRLSKAISSPCAGMR